MSYVSPASTWLGPQFGCCQGSSRRPALPSKRGASERGTRQPAQMNPHKGKYSFRITIGHNKKKYGSIFSRLRIDIFPIRVDTLCSGVWSNLV